ncbi:MAG: hypothetical protein ACLPYB_12340 [Desulfobaccales bacterium]
MKDEDNLSTFLILILANQLRVKNHLIDHKIETEESYWIKKAIELFRDQKDYILSELLKA